MSREAFEKWVNENIKKEFDPIDINDVYKAWQEQAKRIAELEALNKELVEVADMLLMAKEYKEQVGKDDAYETMKNLAWANLKTALAKVKAVND